MANPDLPAHSINAIEAPTGVDSVEVRSPMHFEDPQDADAIATAVALIIEDGAVVLDGGGPESGGSIIDGGDI